MSSLIGILQLLAVLVEPASLFLVIVVIVISCYVNLKIIIINAVCLHALYISSIYMKIIVLFYYYYIN